MFDNISLSFWLYIVLQTIVILFAMVLIRSLMQEYKPLKNIWNWIRPSPLTCLGFITFEDVMRISYYFPLYERLKTKHRDYSKINNLTETLLFGDDSREATIAKTLIKDMLQKDIETGKLEFYFYPPSKNIKDLKIEDKLFKTSEICYWFYMKDYAESGGPDMLLPKN